MKRPQIIDGSYRVVGSKSAAPRRGFFYGWARTAWVIVLGAATASVMYGLGLVVRPIADRFADWLLAL